MAISQVLEINKKEITKNLIKNKNRYDAMK